MSIADSDQVELSCEVKGEGEVMVLIAGLASDRASWRGFDHLLARSFRVLTFDHRGIGGSKAPRGTYDVATLATDLVQLLDRVGVDRAHVLGVSMGGMVALELAIRYGNRVGCLVLGCTHPGGALQVRPPNVILDRLTGLGKTPEQMAHDFLAITHSPRFMDEHPEIVEQMLSDRVSKPVLRRTYSSQLGAIRSHDVSTRLDAIDSPTLVVAGADDELVPPANSRILADRIASATLVLLPGVGHTFWIEDPNRAALEVEQFVASSSQQDGVRSGAPKGAARDPA